MSKIINKKNLIKKANIEISDYSLGAWAIGGKDYGDVSNETAKSIIRSYLDAGGNHIDTARGYNESERIIGEVLKESSAYNDTVISTKSLAGQTLETIPQLRKDLETSLKELQKDSVDIFYLHFPPSEKDVMNAALNECVKFKEEGLIRAIGASIKGPDVTADTLKMAEDYIQDGRVDVLLMVYSIFRQLNASVFELAFKNDVAIVVRTVMESGFLTGFLKKGMEFPESDHRFRWNEQVDEIVDHTENIKKIAVNAPYEGLNEVAIRFASALDTQTSVLIGAQALEHMEQNLKAISRPPLKPEVINKLREDYGGMTDFFNSGFGTKSFK